MNIPFHIRQDLKDGMKPETVISRCRCGEPKDEDAALCSWCHDEPEYSHDDEEDQRYEETR